METRIERVNIASEIAMWREKNLSCSSRMIERLKTLNGMMFEGAWIKKIVWDENGGYPEHSWGFVQYTLRPYLQGYGCDGTTDKNIHQIAFTMSQIEGWDYVNLYHRAYHEDAIWLKEIQKDTGVQQETLHPFMNTAKTWALALSDLYQINNRSLESVLEELVLDKYPEAKMFLSL